MNEAIEQYYAVKGRGLSHGKKKHSLLQRVYQGHCEREPGAPAGAGLLRHPNTRSSAASNAIGMGAATTFVLVCSNGVISLLRKVIPDKVRIPAFITVIAGFVTVVQLFIQAFSPSLDKALGVFLP